MKIVKNNKREMDNVTMDNVCAKKTMQDQFVNTN